MRCPRDQTGLISFISSKPHTHAYTCPSCSGIWLPSETVRRLFAGHRSAETRFGDLIASRFAQVASPDRHCVTCKKTRLCVCKIGEIEVDFCPKCHGVWLDEGELQRLKRWHDKHKPARRGAVAGELADGLIQVVGDVGTEMVADALAALVELVVNAVTSV